VRNSGQNALARDLDGWTNTRRWVHGRHWRSDSRNSREDGLNELGEAPPPYVPAAKTATETGSTEELQVPLRTLSRNGERPPGYGEVLRASPTEQEEERPTTAFPGSSSHAQPESRS